jgi:thiol-disulfide isomerase/thioredoxin
MEKQLHVIREGKEWATWVAQRPPSSFTLLFFYFPSCSACQLYEPIKQEIVRNWTLLNRPQKDLSFVAVDITKAVQNQDVELRQLCDKFGVKSVPSNILTQSLEDPLPFPLHHTKWLPFLSQVTLRSNPSLVDKGAFSGLYEILYVMKHWKIKDKVLQKQNQLLQLVEEEAHDDDAQRRFHTSLTDFS